MEYTTDEYGHLTSRCGRIRIERSTRQWRTSEGEVTSLHWRGFVDGQLVPTGFRSLAEMQRVCETRL